MGKYTLSGIILFGLIFFALDNTYAMPSLESGGPGKATRDGRIIQSAKPKPKPKPVPKPKPKPAPKPVVKEGKTDIKPFLGVQPGFEIWISKTDARKIGNVGAGLGSLLGGHFAVKLGQKVLSYVAGAIIVQWGTDNLPAVYIKVILTPVGPSIIEMRAQ